MMHRKQAAVAALAVLLTAEVIARPLRDGWRRMETDFPNYYTAAILTAKHMPLREFYEWSWFQRQINRAGIRFQPGGYIPHTPLTMMPFLPLTGFPPQRAKQIWLILQMILLASSAFLLARIGRLAVLESLIIILLARAAVAANFRLGQYYILILFLLTAAFWSLLRRRDYLGGALLGAIFALKLYTLPFAFYFAVRRQWKALAGFGGAVAGLWLLAAAVFGWGDIWFFAHTVMARGLDGSVNDPYNPGWASMTGFLRRTLMAEPALNPHPAWNAPAAFFFLRAVYILGVLGVALAALAKWPAEREGRALAWFVMVLFVLSPNEASYHFVLLAVPVAMLLAGAPRLWGAGLLALYIALELPLYRWDAPLFPKAWLMLALFLYTGWPLLRGLRPRTVGAVGLAVVAVSAAAAFARMRVFRLETPQVAHLAILESGGIYSERPSASAGGFVHEIMAGDRFGMRWWNQAGSRTFRFAGDAFHPVGMERSPEIAFELVRDSRSSICLFDPASGGVRVAVEAGLDPTEPALSPDGTKLVFVSAGSLYLEEGGNRRVLAEGAVSNPAFVPGGDRIVCARGRPGARSVQSIPLSGGSAITLVGGGDCFQPAVSPDGRYLAYACSATGGRHLWIRSLESGRASRLTYGFCNNDSPAWERDSRSIVFASDCSRGLGLSALYRLTPPESTSGGRR